MPNSRLIPPRAPPRAPRRSARVPSRHQRGNRRQPTYFSPADHALYLSLLREWAERAGTAVWAWCLMPNHVHLILVPSQADGLRAALGEAHRRYTRAINFREGWRGHLWQSRFASVAMDEPHALAAARYIELNPVRARLVERPEDWRWSSARMHLGLDGERLGDPNPLLARCPDWRALLDGGIDDRAMEALRNAERSGLPLGDDAFLDALGVGGRTVRPRPRGRPRKPD